MAGTVVLVAVDMAATEAVEAATDMVVVVEIAAIRQ
jgi:hypothetical protein